MTDFDSMQRSGAVGLERSGYSTTRFGIWISFAASTPGQRDDRTAELALACFSQRL